MGIVCQGCFRFESISPAFFKHLKVRQFLKTTAGIFSSGFELIRSSRLAKILLLIVFIKFMIFYGFLKGFLYPKYLKPHYESDAHRTEQVLHDLTTPHKTVTNDREH